MYFFWTTYFSKFTSFTINKMNKYPFCFVSNKYHTFIHTYISQLVHEHRRHTVWIITRMKTWNIQQYINLYYLQQVNRYIRHFFYNNLFKNHALNLKCCFILKALVWMNSFTMYFCLRSLLKNIIHNPQIGKKLRCKLP